MKKRSGYMFKRNGTYYLEYTVNGVRFRQSLKTKIKRDAEVEADRILAPFKAQDEAETVAAIAARLETANETAALLGPSIHLGQAWNEYLEAEKRKTPGKGTLGDYESIYHAFKKWVGEKQPDTRTMRDITPEMARAFLKYLEKDRELSGDRVNKHLVFLRAMFELLKQPAALSSNPWAEIPKREHTRLSRRPLTIEEMRTIIETAEGELKTLFMLGAFTGLRMGDCATLRWGECDLARGIIHRIPRKTARKGIAVVVGIPPILGERLASLDRNGAFILPEIARTYLDRKEYLSRRIQAHFVKCGIETMGDGAGKRAACLAGFHSLRHSYISLQIQAGTPQAHVQKLAGHKNPIMTEHYTHLDEATATATARALPPILGEAKPEKRDVPAWILEAVKNARSIKDVRVALGVN